MASRDIYPVPARRQLEEFLRGRLGEPWCTECLERELGRRLHATPVLLEGYRGFRREDAPCVRCGKVRLILKCTDRPSTTR